MISVGLTGGIACGKSTVAAILRRRGYPVLDLDDIARVVVAPGSAALAQIAALWPDVVMDGTLDRKALGAIVVADRAARSTLESITHPHIWAAMEEWIAVQQGDDSLPWAGLPRSIAVMTRPGSPPPAAFIEAALMVETGSYRRYDKLLVVSCSPSVQRQRLATREGWDNATVERWLTTQLPLAEKERVADAIIRNDGEVDALDASIDAALTTLGLPTGVST